MTTSSITSTSRSTLETVNRLFAPHSGIAEVVVRDANPAAEIGLSHAADVRSPREPASTGEVTVVDPDPIPPLPDAQLHDGPAGCAPADRLGVAERAVGGGHSSLQQRRVTQPGTRGTGQMSDSHEELARRARDGDEGAMHALLEAIDADGLVRLPVRRVVMGAQAVEDISQEVLIQVAEKIGTWDGRSRFTTWLYAVARNRAIDHLRRTKPTANLTEDVMSDQGRISSIIATRESVRDALDRLPERYRTSVVLRDIDQLEYDEIARILNLPSATVRTRVSRGRAMVAAALARRAA